MYIKKKLILRVISATLTAAFLMSDIAQAAPEISMMSAHALSPIDSISKDLSLFEAPLDFSSLQEFHQGDKGKPILFHIQDAHSNYSGQQSLASTLNFLIEKYGVSMILVEGSAMDSTLTPVREIIPAEECKRISRSLLMSGQIAGEEYLNLTTNHPMEVLGVEDEKLYFQSLNSYAALADKREAIFDYLKQIQSVLEKLKRKHYPAELLRYEAAGTAADRTDALLSLANEKKTDLGSFPNLEKVDGLKQKEKAIDFTLANLEQAKIIEEISKGGGGEDFRSELEKLNRSKNNRAAQFSFFQNILNNAKEKNISLQAYPNLVLYGAYLKEFSGIELEKLLDETQKAEDLVYRQALSSSEGNTALLIRSIDRYLKLLDTAYHIRMTSKEFSLFLANEPDFSTTAYLGFINRRLTEDGYFQDLIPMKNSLEQGKKALTQFYESVGKRDEAFLWNAKRFLGQNKQKAAVLISGGYHTQHLKQLFRAEGYGYAVLTPVVTAETNQAKYEKLLLSPIRKEVKKVEMSGEKAVYKSPSALGSGLMLDKKDRDGLRYLSVVSRLSAHLPDNPVEKVFSAASKDSERFAVVAARLAERAVNPSFEPLPLMATRLAGGSELSAQNDEVSKLTEFGGAQSSRVDFTADDKASNSLRIYRFCYSSDFPEAVQPFLFVMTEALLDGDPYFDSKEVIQSLRYESGPNPSFSTVEIIFTSGRQISAKLGELNYRVRPDQFLKVKKIESSLVVDNELKTETALKLRWVQLVANRFPEKVTVSGGGLTGADPEIKVFGADGSVVMRVSPQELTLADDEQNIFNFAQVDFKLYKKIENLRLGLSALCGQLENRIAAGELDSAAWQGWRRDTAQEFLNLFRQEKVYSTLHNLGSVGALTWADGVEKNILLARIQGQWLSHQRLEALWGSAEKQMTDMEVFFNSDGSEQGPLTLQRLLSRFSSVTIPFEDEGASYDLRQTAAEVRESISVIRKMLRQFHRGPVLVSAPSSKEKYPDSEMKKVLEDAFQSTGFKTFQVSDAQLASFRRLFDFDSSQRSLRQYAVDFAQEMKKAILANTPTKLFDGMGMSQLSEDHDIHELDSLGRRGKILSWRWFFGKYRAQRKLEKFKKAYIKSLKAYADSRGWQMNDAQWIDNGLESTIKVQFMDPASTSKYLADDPKTGGVVYVKTPVAELARTLRLSPTPQGFKALIRLDKNVMGRSDLGDIYILPIKGRVDLAQSLFEAESRVFSGYLKGVVVYGVLASTVLKQKWFQALYGNPLFARQLAKINREDMPDSDRFAAVAGENDSLGARLAESDAASDKKLSDYDEKAWSETGLYTTKLRQLMDHPNFIFHLNDPADNKDPLRIRLDGMDVQVDLTEDAGTPGFALSIFLKRLYEQLYPEEAAQSFSDDKNVEDELENFEALGSFALMAIYGAFIGFVMMFLPAQARVALTILAAPLFLIFMKWTGIGFLKIAWRDFSKSLWFRQQKWVRRTEVRNLITAFIKKYSPRSGSVYSRLDAARLAGEIKGREWESKSRPDKPGIRIAVPVPGQSDNDVDEGALAFNMGVFAARYPDFAAALGFVALQNGSFEYPEPEELNRRIEVYNQAVSEDRKITARFRSTEVAGPETPETVVKNLAEGFVIYNAAGPHHFHDLNVHLLAYLLMPSPLFEKVKAQAGMLMSLKGDERFAGSPAAQALVGKEIEEMSHGMDGATAYTTSIVLSDGWVEAEGNSGLFSSEEQQVFLFSRRLAQLEGAKFPGHLSESHPNHKPHVLAMLDNSTAAARLADKSGGTVDEATLRFALQDVTWELLRKWDESLERSARSFPNAAPILDTGKTGLIFIGSGKDYFVFKSERVDGQYVIKIPRKPSTGSSSSPVLSSPAQDVDSQMIAADTLRKKKISVPTYRLNVQLRDGGDEILPVILQREVTTLAEWFAQRGEIDETSMVEFARFQKKLWAAGLFDADVSWRNVGIYSAVLKTFRAGDLRLIDFGYVSGRGDRNESTGDLLTPGEFFLYNITQRGRFSDIAKFMPFYREIFDGITVEELEKVRSIFSDTLAHKPPVEPAKAMLRFLRSGVNSRFISSVLQKLRLPPVAARPASPLVFRDTQSAQEGLIESNLAILEHENSGVPEIVRTALRDKAARNLSNIIRITLRSDFAGRLFTASEIDTSGSLRLTLDVVTGMITGIEGAPSSVKEKLRPTIQAFNARVSRRAAGRIHDDLRSLSGGIELAALQQLMTESFVADPRRREIYYSAPGSQEQKTFSEAPHHLAEILLGRSQRALREDISANPALIEDVIDQYLDPERGPNSFFQSNLLAAYGSKINQWFTGLQWPSFKRVPVSLTEGQELLVQRSGQFMCFVDGRIQLGTEDGIRMVVSRSAEEKDKLVYRLRGWGDEIIIEEDNPVEILKGIILQYTVNPGPLDKDNFTLLVVNRSNNKISVKALGARLASDSGAEMDVLARYLGGDESLAVAAAKIVNYSRERLEDDTVYFLPFILSPENIPQLVGLLRGLADPSMSSAGDDKRAISRGAVSRLQLTGGVSRPLLDSELRLLRGRQELASQLAAVFGLLSAAKDYTKFYQSKIAVLTAEVKRFAEAPPMPPFALIPPTDAGTFQKSGIVEVGKSVRFDYSVTGPVNLMLRDYELRVQKSPEGSFEIFMLKQKGQIYSLDYVAGLDNTRAAIFRREESEGVSELILKTRFKEAVIGANAPRKISRKEHVIIYIDGESIIVQVDPDRPSNVKYSFGARLSADIPVSAQNGKKPAKTFVEKYIKYFLGVPTAFLAVILVLHLYFGVSVDMARARLIVRDTIVTPTPYGFVRGRRAIEINGFKREELPPFRKITKDYAERTDLNKDGIPDSWKVYSREKNRVYSVTDEGKLFELEESNDDGTLLRLKAYPVNSIGGKMVPGFGADSLGTLPVELRPLIGISGARLAMASVSQPSGYIGSYDSLTFDYQKTGPVTLAVGGLVLRIQKNSERAFEALALGYELGTTESTQSVTREAVKHRIKLENALNTIFRKKGGSGYAAVIKNSSGIHEMAQQNIDTVSRTHHAYITIEGDRITVQVNAGKAAIHFKFNPILEDKPVYSTPPISQKRNFIALASSLTPVFKKIVPTLTGRTHQIPKTTTDSFRKQVFQEAEAIVRAHLDGSAATEVLGYLREIIVNDGDNEWKFLEASHALRKIFSQNGVAFYDACQPAKGTGPFLIGPIQYRAWMDYKPHGQFKEIQYVRSEFENIGSSFKPGEHNDAVYIQMKAGEDPLSAKIMYAAIHESVHALDYEGDTASLFADPGSVFSKLLNDANREYAADLIALHLTLAYLEGMWKKTRDKRYLEEIKYIIREKLENMVEKHLKKPDSILKIQVADLAVQSVSMEGHEGSTYKLMRLIFNFVRGRKMFVGGAAMDRKQFEDYLETQGSDLAWFEGFIRENYLNDSIPENVLLENIGKLGGLLRNESHDFYRSKLNGKLPIYVEQAEKYILEPVSNPIVVAAARLSQSPATDGPNKILKHVIPAATRRPERALMNMELWVAEHPRLSWMTPVIHVILARYRSGGLKKSLQSAHSWAVKNPSAKFMQPLIEAALKFHKKYIDRRVFDKRRAGIGAFAERLWSATLRLTGFDVLLEFYGKNWGNTRALTQPVDLNNPVSLQSSIRELTAQLRELHPVYKLRNELHEGERVLALLFGGTKFGNDTWGEAASNELISERQKMVLQVLRAHGIIPPKELDSESQDKKKGVLAQEYNQDKLVVSDFVEKEASLKQALAEIETRVREIAKKTFPGISEEQLNSFSVFAGVSGELKFEAEADQDEARIEILFQALAATKIAKLKRDIPDFSREMKDEGFGNGSVGVYRLSEFDQCVEKALALGQSLEIYQAGSQAVEMSQDELKSVRGKSFQSLRGDIENHVGGAQRAYDLSQFLGLVDLFDFPRSWAGDYKAMADDIQKLIERLEGAPDPYLGYGDAVPQAVDLLKSSLKDKRAVNSDVFHIEVSKRKGILVSVDVAGLGPQIKQLEARTLLEYSRLRQTENDPSLAYRMATSADKQVKSFMANKSRALRSAVSTNGYKVATLEKKMKTTLEAAPELILRDGGDEIVLFIETEGDQEWQPDVEALLALNVRVSIAEVDGTKPPKVTRRIDGPHIPLEPSPTTIDYLTTFTDILTLYADGSVGAASEQDLFLKQLKKEGVISSSAVIQVKRDKKGGKWYHVYSHEKNQPAEDFFPSAPVLLSVPNVAVSQPVKVLMTVPDVNHPQAARLASALFGEDGDPFGYFREKTISVMKDDFEAHKLIDSVSPPKTRDLYAMMEELAAAVSEFEEISKLKTRGTDQQERAVRALQNIRQQTDRISGFLKWLDSVDPELERIDIKKLPSFEFFPVFKARASALDLEVSGVEAEDTEETSAPEIVRLRRALWGIYHSFRPEAAALGISLSDTFLYQRLLDRNNELDDFCEAYQRARSGVEHFIDFPRESVADFEAEFNAAKKDINSMLDAANRPFGLFARVRRRGDSLLEEKPLLVSSLYKFTRPGENVFWDLLHLPSVREEFSKDEYGSKLIQTYIEKTRRVEVVLRDLKNLKAKWNKRFSGGSLRVGGSRQLMRGLLAGAPAKIREFGLVLDLARNHLEVIESTQKGPADFEAFLYDLGILNSRLDELYQDLASAADALATPLDTREELQELKKSLTALEGSANQNLDRARTLMAARLADARPSIRRVREFLNTLRRDELIPKFRLQGGIYDVSPRRVLRHVFFKIRQALKKSSAGKFSLRGKKFFGFGAGLLDDSLEAYARGWSVVTGENDHTVSAGAREVIRQIESQNLMQVKGNADFQVHLNRSAFGLNAIKDTDALYFFYTEPLMPEQSVKGDEERTQKRRNAFRARMRTFVNRMKLGAVAAFVFVGDEAGSREIGSHIFSPEEFELVSLNSIAHLPDDKKMYDNLLYLGVWRKKERAIGAARLAAAVSIENDSLVIRRDASQPLILDQTDPAALAQAIRDAFPLDENILRIVLSKQGEITFAVNSRVQKIAKISEAENDTQPGQEPSGTLYQVAEIVRYFFPGIEPVIRKSGREFWINGGFFQAGNLKGFTDKLTGAFTGYAPAIDSNKFKIIDQGAHSVSIIYGQPDENFAYFTAAAADKAEIALWLNKALSAITKANLEGPVQFPESARAGYGSSVWYNHMHRMGRFGFANKTVAIRYSTQFRALRDYLDGLLSGGQKKSIRLVSLGAGDGREPVSWAAYLLWLQDPKAEGRTDTDKAIGDRLKGMDIKIIAVDSPAYKLLNKNLDPQNPAGFTAYHESYQAIDIINHYLAEIKKRQWIDPQNLDFNNGDDQKTLGVIFGQGVEVVVSNEIFHHLEKKTQANIVRMLSQSLTPASLLLASEMDGMEMAYASGLFDDDLYEPSGQLKRSVVMGDFQMNHAGGESWVISKKAAVGAAARLSPAETTITEPPILFSQIFGARLVSVQAGSVTELRPLTLANLALLSQKNPALIKQGLVYSFLNTGVVSSNARIRFVTGGIELIRPDSEVDMMGESLGFVRFSKATLREAEALAAKRSVPVQNGVIQAASPKLLEVLAEERSTEARARQFYNEALKNGVISNARPVVLRFVTQGRLNPVLFKAQLSRLRSIVGNNVCLQLTRLNPRNKRAYAYWSSDAIPADRAAYELVYVSELSADVLGLAKANHAGYSAAASLKKGSVVPFVASGTFLVSTARLDQFNDSITRLFNNVRNNNLSTFGPREFQITRRVESTDIALYKPLELKSIAELLWKEFMEFTRMEVAVGAAA